MKLNIDGQKEFSQGLQTGLPICLGYFAVSFAFGISAVKMGVSPLMSAFISLTNLSSSGQFAGVQILSALGTYTELVLTVLVINLRYVLMSLSLSQRVLQLNTRQKLIIGYGVTDEIFAAAIREDRELSFAFFLGLMSLPVLGWVGGTATGAFLGELLPASLSNALGIALYCMFLAIVLPPARQDDRVGQTVLMAACLSVMSTYLPVLCQLPVGWRVTLCTLVTALTMAYLDVRAAKKEGGRA